MIKLQDFARECGVTDRAIQKHLKTYADELDGLFERKGPNGTWLSDEACQVLRSKMKQAPIVVGDAEQQREVDDLRKQVADLTDKLLRAYDLVDKAQTQIAAGQERLMLQEGFTRDAKAEIEALKAEHIQELGEVRKQTEAVQSELVQEKTRKISFREYWQRRKGEWGNES